MDTTVVIVFTLELFNMSNTRGSCLSSFRGFRRDSGTQELQLESGLKGPIYGGPLQKWPPRGCLMARGSKHH